MGSKLRRLRVQAGVAGERYQAEQRRQQYRRERAAIIAEPAASRTKNSGQQQGRTVEDNRSFPAAKASYRGAAAPGNSVSQEARERPAGNATTPHGGPVYADRAIDPAADLRPSSRPPAAGMRMSRLLPVLAMSMLFAGLPGKEES